MHSEPSGKLQRLIFEQLEGIAITDPEGRYLYGNEGWEKLIGCRLEDVRGKYVREIVPTTRIHEALETGRPILGNVTFSKDGQEMFSNYLPVYENGTIIAGFIQIIFGNLEQATAFSKVLSDVKSELNYYKKELSRLRRSKYSIENIVGDSEAASALRSQIAKAANSTSTVLIEGETGTGKELVAHSVHALSQRQDCPFIKINCAAIPSELAESELFGYEHGAFTGAKRGGREGLFQMAHTGTLFLDEINQMSYFTQPKLLRALQEREVTRVGGHTATPVDVRLIAATNRPLEELVREEKFRRDLFYRLNVLTIRTPPLRERAEDIPQLLDSIIERLNHQLGVRIDGVEPDVVRRLQAYNWPGNIRELQNVVERAMNIQYCGWLEWSSFQSYFEGKHLSEVRKKTFTAGEYPLKLQLQELERTIIADAYRTYAGNKKRLAERLGISRTILYQKLREYQLID